MLLDCRPCGKRGQAPFVRSTRTGTDRRLVAAKGACPLSCLGLATVPAGGISSADPPFGATPVVGGAAKFLSPGSSATMRWGAGIVMVHGRWFNFIVVFALAGGDGLAVLGKDIDPELMVGDPPNENTILAAQQSHPTNGWAVFWNNRKIGWAVNTTPHVAERPDAGRQHDPH